jgi:hypothetical protein
MNADIGSISEDPDHVEAQCIEVWFSGIEVMLGDGAQGALFAESDGFERVSVAGSAPQFDFDEDERLGSLVQNTMTSEVRFHALLAEGRTESLQLERI